MRRIIVLIAAVIMVPCELAAQEKNKIPGIVPDHLNLQFAGAIGFLSAGFGYETKNHRFQGDFFYGYVPESVGGIEIHSITAKMTFAAVTRQLRRSQDLRADWLTIGIHANYVFGKQYFLFDPERYPFNYYGFPTAAHVGLSVGGAVYYRKLGLYYELGTTDKYIMSYIQNSGSLFFTDIFNLGLGVKYSIFKHNWQRPVHKKLPSLG